MSNGGSAPLDLSFDWSYAYGGPVGSGVMRTEPEDFVVVENLGFEASGEGEHAFLTVRKRNSNSDWIARQIARLVGVQKMDVGLAGMKDRRAVTTQAFTVTTTGREEPDWSLLNRDQDGEQIELLSVSRHRRKLKRGELAGNHFTIVLRQVDGDQAEIDNRLATIKERGIPNYFGEQRFGFDGDNLQQASRMFSREIKVKDRSKRGIYLSAARSYLFNHLLSLRVEAGNWDQVIDGDWVWTEEDPRGFTFAMDNPQHCELLEQGRLIHAGPLWGDGRSLTERDASLFENRVAAQNAALIEGLKGARMDQSRRPLQMKIDGLKWEWLSSTELQLGFSLPAGSYATALIRELMVTMIPAVND
ncbi:MAG: tRNA pseudouridine(13) synthase TruD [Gammaproteobacteria bacterium]|nr:tRNA pseudouridine(13) synthase TruD [Gammaproteobacteria bacterium]